MKYGTNFDLNKNQLMNAAIHNLTAAPSTPVKGQIYFNTTGGDNNAYLWDGTAWKPMAKSAMTGDDIIAALNASGSKIDDDNLSSAANTAISNSHAHSNKALLDTYTQTEANIADAVSKKHNGNTDTGTTSATFQLLSGSSGVKIKGTSSELAIRNSADTGFADLRVANLYVEGTTFQITSNTVNIGDSNIELNNDITTNAMNSDGGITIKRLKADNTTRADAVLNFNNSTGRWESTFGSVANPLITAPLVNKVTAVIGDGSAKNFVITHNLNSQLLTVDVIENTTPPTLIITDVEFTSVNTLTVKFAAETPTAGQYSVVIIG